MQLKQGQGVPVPTSGTKLQVNIEILSDITGGELWCRDYWYGVLTSVFIFLPGCNVLSAFYGPSTAAFLCSIWGDIFMICAMLIWLLASTMTAAVISWFLFLLGLGMILFGSFGKDRAKQQTNKTWWERTSHQIPQIISYPLLLFSSPFLVLLTKFFYILRPKNKFIENQKKYAAIR